MEYGNALAQVATKASAAPQLSKKAGSRDSQERAQPALRRCGNYGETRHNTQTCKKDTEESSKSNARTAYAGSLFNSDEINNV